MLKDVKILMVNDCQEIEIEPIIILIATSIVSSGIAAT